MALDRLVHAPETANGTTAPAVAAGRARARYTIPISQSTRKAQVLVGGGSEEFRVGDAADACRQLYARAASCRHLLKLGKFRQLNHSNW